jgi:hypothetical protein
MNRIDLKNIKKNQIFVEHDGRYSVKVVALEDCRITKDGYELKAQIIEENRKPISDEIYVDYFESFDSKEHLGLYSDYAYIE